MKKKIYAFLLVLSVVLAGIGLHNFSPEDKVYLPEKTQNITPLPTPYETEKPKPKEDEPEIENVKAPLMAEEKLPEPEEEIFCTLTIRCDDVLENMDKLSEAKKKIIPHDGMILPKEKIFFSEGESAFDILLRVTRERGIHMEFVNTPMYNSAYIEGIGNLYEFDLGETSGWTYTVNDERLMYGCSQHQVKNGDNIEFIYISSLY